MGSKKTIGGSGSGRTQFRGDSKYLGGQSAKQIHGGAKKGGGKSQNTGGSGMGRAKGIMSGKC